MAGASEEPDSDITDNHVSVNLQQMVFVLDKPTVLRLTEVAATLFGHFDAE
jgi:hypothetical protein